MKTALFVLCLVGLSYVGLMFLVRRALERLTPEELGRLLREMGDEQ